MKRQFANLSMIVIIVVLSTSTAYALRCGNRLVSVGDTKTELLRHCGKPVEVYHRKEHQPVRIYDKHNDHYRIRYDLIYLEEWIYNFGANRFMRSILFKHGRIHKIESLGYGY